MFLVFEGFPEMFVLCNIYCFRNPVGLVLVLVFSRDNRKLDRPLSASLGIFGLVNVASVW